MNRYAVQSLFFIFLTLFSFSSFANEQSKSEFTKTIIIKSTKEVVWFALTNESELSQWWNDGVKIEARIGGEFYEPWGEDQLATGVVTDLKVNEFISFTWQEKNWKKSEVTLCTFLLKESNGITTLTVRHSGWDTFKDPIQKKELMEGFHSAWDFFLGKLSVHLKNKQ